MALTPTHDSIDGGPGNETIYLGARVPTTPTSGASAHRTNTCHLPKPPASWHGIAGGLLPRHHHQLHGGDPMRRPRHQRTLGTTPVHRPARPPRPSAAVWVAPEVAVTPVPATGDPVVTPMPPTTPDAALSTRSVAANPPPAPESRRRGTHVRKDDPLLGAARGAHIRRDDPLAAASWEVHVTEDDALALVLAGAHVMADDPLVVDVVSVPTEIDGALVWEPVAEGLPPVEAARAQPDASCGEPVAGGDSVRARARRRRWRLVPVVGAVTALVAGLGGGAAFAYFTASGAGSGNGQATSGRPVTISVDAATGALEPCAGQSR